MERKESRIAKAMRNNKRIAGGITISNFKLNYRAIIIKTASIGTIKLKI